MAEDDSGYINVTRVMKDASQGNFDYLLESLRHLQIVWERRNINIRSRRFPTDWLPYLHENIASREPPSLFHYIILYNRKDVLDHTYQTLLSTPFDRHGIVSAIIQEAIWLKNQPFQEIGWSLLQNHYVEKSDRICIHKPVTSRPANSER
jgi:hypothetical protein